MKKKLQLKNNLFLSLVCLSPILTCFKLEVMICIAQGKEKKKMSHQGREGVGRIQIVFLWGNI